MWLTVINNPSETMESFMFAIIPEQYENKTYPGGLVNINDEGRYVVTKYDMSNREIRSAVKSLSYGDYVIDNEESCFQIYVGSSSYGKARAVSDTELNEFDLPEKIIRKLTTLSQKNLQEVIQFTAFLKKFQLRW